MTTLVRPKSPDVIAQVFERHSLSWHIVDDLRREMVYLHRSLFTDSVGANQLAWSIVRRTWKEIYLGTRYPAKWNHDPTIHCLIEVDLLAQ